jgi:hypothetical protein
MKQVRGQELQEMERIYECDEANYGCQEEEEVLSQPFFLIHVVIYSIPGIHVVGKTIVIN